MQELAAQVNLDKQLLYRPYANQLYDMIAKELDSLKGGTLIECSFEGIEGCDASFADGFVIRLQKSVSRYSNVVLYLSHCNDVVIENLKGALLVRNEASKEKNNLLYLDGKFRFVISQERNLQETFDFVQESDEVSAREVAEHFQIEINSASNRLKKLYDDNRLFRREIKDEKGRQHIYSINS